MKIKFVLMSLTILTATVAFGHENNEQKFLNALKSEQRAQADRDRDAGRKPEKVMKIF